MTTTIPVRRLTLYKHGISVVERQGTVEGDQVTLSFHRDQMNDVLKSLVALDLSGGQVRQVAFEAQEDRDLKLSRVPLQFSGRQALLDLLVALRGQSVRLVFEENGQSRTVEGQVVGLDVEPEKPFKRGRVTVRTTSGLRVLPLKALRDATLLDLTARGDLDYVLDLLTAEPDQRAVTLRLSEGAHDLQVRYLVPSPTWRVSYRFVGDAGAERALVQGWGIIDNPLDEPLESVQLSLVSGMPISFVYDLYSPFTPDRPHVEEEARVAAAPIEMERGRALAKATPEAAMSAPRAAMRFAADTAAMPAADALQSTTAIAAQGEAQGDLFAYHIEPPVSVARGEAAMVPILGEQFEYRKEHIYNEQKMPAHPSVVLRFRNESGLTLERGPVTVMEGENYLGEAIFPFTRPGSEVLLAISVDLGIRVRSERSTARETVGVAIKDGFLMIQQYTTITTRYEVRNQNETGVDLLIEHPRTTGFTPFQMGEPAETTEQHTRWRVAVPAGPEGEADLTVRERRLDRQRHAVTGINQAALDSYIQNRWLDEAIANELQRLLDIERELQQIAARLQEVEQQRKQQVEAQEQMRKNLGSLRDSGEEGELRCRYVRQLQQSEDALATLAERQQELEAARDQRQAEKQALLADLGAL